MENCEWAIMFSDSYTVKFKGTWEELVLEIRAREEYPIAILKLGRAR